MRGRRSRRRDILYRRLGYTERRCGVISNFGEEL